MSTKIFRSDGPISVSVAKPHCPKHKGDMQYAADRGKWVCPEEGCTITARRAEDSPSRQQDGGIGDNFLRIDESGEENRYWIVVGNQSIEVTEFVEMIIDDQSNSVSLCLLFNDVRRT